MAASHKKCLSPKYRIIVQDIEHELALTDGASVEEERGLNICSICRTVGLMGRKELAYGVQNSLQDVCIAPQFWAGRPAAFVSP
jgi:hypothetical protein